MKKAAGLVIGALAFGAIAGATMVGINMLADNTVLAGSDNSETGIEDILGDSGQSGSADSAGGAGPEVMTASASDALKASVLDVSDIVERAMPQVVSITNTIVYTRQGYDNFFDYFYNMPKEYEYEAPASGSGVIIGKTDKELQIVTNNHVVADSSRLDVTFADGSTASANIKGTDSDLDLAVIAVNLSDLSEDTLNSIDVAKLHTEEDLKVGQGVIAIGNAMGYGQSVTVGYISALDRDIQTEDGGMESGLIQVDAAINPGNSGGALLNMNGELIGINVAKLASSQVDSIGYSIPIYKVMDTINSLSNSKTKVEVPEDSQGALGVTVTTVTAEQEQTLGIPRGAIIIGFDEENGSAAEDAGLLKNDVITSLDGQTITSSSDLSSNVRYYEAGETVTVGFMRLENGEYVEHSADVTLGKRPVTQTESQSGETGASEDGSSEGSSENGNGESGSTDNSQQIDELFGELFGGNLK